MQKSALCLLFSLSILAAQSQKNYSLSVSANFDFLTAGLGMNDAGIGFTIHYNSFAQHKLQLRTEVSLDHFIGSKLLMLDSAGNQYYDNPTWLALKSGPEYHFTRGLAVAVLYGYVQYEEFKDKVQSAHVKFILTARPPKHPKMLIGFQYTMLTGDYSYVHFAGINIGFQVL
ncbi:MAG: hypothetical protein ACXVLT_05060 [Flavisolibacter sp.]